MVKVKAAAQNEAAFSASAAASSITSVKVTFTKAVDADSVTKDSFKFADEKVSVQEAALSADGLSADLTIAGAVHGASYDMTVTGVKIAGAVQDDLKLTFKTPEAAELYQIKLEPADSFLKADGQDTTNVKFTILDKDGKPLDEKVEVEFSATMGNFAEKRVTVKKDGTAENMYSSEMRPAKETAVITARIVEASSTEMLRGIEKTTNITLDPNYNGVDTSLGAIIVNAEAATADRVIAYFNQDVKAKDFQTAAGYMDETKFTAKVYSGLDNNYETTGKSLSDIEQTVIGVMGVDGQPNALQLLLDEPMIDNSNVRVEFEDKHYTDSVAHASNTAKFKLTDARQPSVLNVDNEGQQKIVIEFSEAVLPKELADTEDQKKFAADITDNYTIDGRPLKTYGITKEGKDNNNTKDTDESSENAVLLSSKHVEDPGIDEGKIEIGSFKKGKDTRHIVTITTKDGQTFAPGWHSLQVSNVGDWAAKTDLERNIVNTQTFDFYVEAENTKPAFEVEVQSPEQYLVKFNTSIKLADANDHLTTEDSSAPDDVSKAWKSILKLQRQTSSGWETISDKAGESGNKMNSVRITRVKDENSDWTNEYLVEVKKDWSVVYDLKGKNRNYYNDNYRLFIEKGKILNSSNGEKNDDLEGRLEGAMKEPDNTSPEIVNIEQEVDPETGKATDYYTVTMSKPVKLSDTANQEGLTPSQKQGSNVPTPLVEFIKQGSSYSDTIEGKVDKDTFIDAYDKVFRVKPDGKELSSGTWDVAVRAVSDDYGNTPATLVKPINVTTEEKKTGFEIVWMAVATDNDYNTITSDYGSYIFVKFNKAVSVYGGSASAMNTSNYTLDGATLPLGTNIKAGIAGYDEAQNSDGLADSVTIILPQATDRQKPWTVSGKDTVLNIARTITAADGEKLSNGGEQKLPFQYGENGGCLINGKTVNFELNKKGDAVWGNDESEQMCSNHSGDCKFGYHTKDVNGKKKYYAALFDALNSNKYRKVVLSANLDVDNDKNGFNGTLNITRAVDLDLNGHNIEGNVVINTTDAANEMNIINSGVATNGKIRGLSNNGEDKYSLTVNTPKITHFNIRENVEVCKNGDNDNGLKLEGVWPDTFVNLGKIEGINIAGNAGFMNEGTVTGKITVSAAANVTLKGNFKATDLSNLNGIEVTAGATVNLDAKFTGTTITVTKEAKIKLPSGSNTSTAPTIVADGVKVTLVGNEESIKAMKDNNKLEGNGDDGKFVSNNGKDGKEQLETDSKEHPTDVQKVLDTVADAVSGAALTAIGGTTNNIAYGTEAGTIIDISSAFDTGYNSVTVSGDKLAKEKIEVTADNTSWLTYDKTNKTIKLAKKNDVTSDQTISITLTFKDTTENSKAMRTLEVKFILKKSAS